MFSYDPPTGAGPVDVAARAAEFARQYIEEDLQGEQRQAAVAWEKAAWVEEALAWLRDEGVQLPDDMEEKVAAAAAAAAAEAAAEDVAGGAGQGGAGAAAVKEVSEAERRRHLPELKRVAQKAAAGGPGAQHSWRELAVRLATLARISRRRLLQHEADPTADALHGAALQHASSLPLAQVAAAAAQGQMAQRAGSQGANPTPAGDAEQGWGSDQLSDDGATELQQQLTKALSDELQQEDGEEEEQEAVVAAGAQLEAPSEGSLAAALLRLFDPGAAGKAHAAARKLKSEVMQHNSRVAAEFLAGTARLIAQVEAEEAAAREAAQQQQPQQAQAGAGATASAGAGAIDPVQMERELYRIAAAERANPTGLV